MAMTLDELTKSLKTGSYKPLTEEEIQQQAKNKYQAELDAAKLAAQQVYDKTALALDNQRAELDQSYAQQTETARENTARTYSAADRHALSRGMQRSTYNNSTLANINMEGDETLNRLAEALQTDQNALASQKSLAQQQLAQQLAQYDTSFNSQVSAYADQLRDLNYQRQLEQDKYHNQLQAMLYEYGLKAGAGGSGGGGSRSTPKKDTSLLDDLDNYNNKNKTNSKIDWGLVESSLRNAQTKAMSTQGTAQKVWSSLEDSLKKAQTKAMSTQGTAQKVWSSLEDSLRKAQNKAQR